MYTSLTDSTEGKGGIFIGGGGFMAKIPLLERKNSKMSLKKLHIIIVEWSTLLWTTDNNQGHTIYAKYMKFIITKNLTINR